MCYEVLQDDHVTDRSIPALLRLESRAAVINGLEAAVLVALVLLWQGTTLLLVAASAIAALTLGALLHQLVLIGGAVLIRHRRRARANTPSYA